MPFGFSQAILLFILYSFLGWAAETLIASLYAKRFVYRGLLAGPLCPSYGLGALVFMWAGAITQGNPIFVFLMAAGIATLLELLTGGALQLLFHIRWWNHKNRRLQLKDRISINNILLFGLMGTLLYYYTFPFTLHLFSALSPISLRVITSVLLVIVFIDILYTLGTLFSLGETIKKLEPHSIKLHMLEAETPTQAKSDFGALLTNLQKIYSNKADNPEIGSMLASVDNLVAMGPGARRILRAFPNMEYSGVSPHVLNWLRTTWFEHASDGYTIPLPKQFIPRMRESFVEIAHDWNPRNNGMTFSVFVWIFTIGSVLGYVLETLFCLVVEGRIMSRQGMLYGPFSQVYGFGAIALVLLLQPLVKKGSFHVFIGGALVGGIFEYGMSYVQEFAFGTVSWDYSNLPLSIGGRTSIMYMFFWGILSVLFFKFVFPLFLLAIKRIPPKPRRSFAILLTVVLGANLLLSAAAVSRWTSRQHGQPAANILDITMDTYYPDEFMREIYPYMQVVTLPANTIKPK